MTTPSTPTLQTSYLRIAEERAPTVSGKSAIRYAILANPERSRLFIAVVANEGGGNWNREAVALADVETVLGELTPGEPFSSKLLQAACTGKSSNNAGFLAAALMHAGLIAPAPDVKHKLVVVGNWTAWQAEMLAHEGEDFVFPPSAGGPSPAAPVEEPATGKKAKRASRRPAVEAGVTDEDSRHADHP